MNLSYTCTHEVGLLPSCLTKISKFIKVRKGEEVGQSERVLKSTVSEKSLRGFSSHIFFTIKRNEKKTCSEC
jgi:hypothetical protein